MCPDPQLLSILADGELPSPWKEKLENHLTECSVCSEKLENFRRLRELFKKDTNQRRVIVEKENVSAEAVPSEREIMEAAKEKIWRNLESRRRFRSGGVNRRYAANLWQRKFSVPLPAAAAAAIAIMLLTAMWVSGGFTGQNKYYNNSGYANQYFEPSNFILTAEEEIQGIIPTSADISSILQYLGTDRPDIIILQLPESKNFLSSGEPAIIRAADYSRR